MYQNVRDGKFVFLTESKKFSKWPEFYFLEPGLYFSIMEIVETMSTLLQKNLIAAKTVSQLKCHEKLKSWDLLCK